MLFITLTDGGKDPLGRCRRFWIGNERISGKSDFEFGKC
jgi:hypothetical protein